MKNEALSCLALKILDIDELHVIIASKICQASLNGKGLIFEGDREQEEARKYEEGRSLKKQIKRLKSCVSVEDELSFLRIQDYLRTDTVLSQWQIAHKFCLRFLIDGPIDEDAVMTQLFNLCESLVVSIQRDFSNLSDGIIELASHGLLDHSIRAGLRQRWSMAEELCDQVNRVEDQFPILSPWYVHLPT